jgi:predicted nucleic acid-binding Zn ribbon protein
MQLTESPEAHSLTDKDRAEVILLKLLYLLDKSCFGVGVWEKCGETMNNMRRRTKKIAEFIFWNNLSYLLYLINQIIKFLVEDNLI